MRYRKKKRVDARMRKRIEFVKRCAGVWKRRGEYVKRSKEYMPPTRGGDEPRLR